MLSDTESSVRNISSTGALTLTVVDTPPSAGAAKSRLNLMLCFIPWQTRTLWSCTSLCNCSNEESHFQTSPVHETSPLNSSCTSSLTLKTSVHCSGRPGCALHSILFIPRNLHLLFKSLMPAVYPFQKDSFEKTALKERGWELGRSLTLQGSQSHLFCDKLDWKLLFFHWNISLLFHGMSSFKQMFCIISHVFFFQKLLQATSP